MPRAIIEIDSDASGAEKGFKDTQEGLDETKKSAEKTARSFEGVATSGDFMSKSLTAPIMALGTAIGVVALRSASWADEMETMADKTGLSLGRLQELRYITSQTNTEFSALTQAAAQLGRRMVSGAEDSKKLGAIFDALGIKTTDQTGKFRAMDDVLPEVLSRLAGMQDVTLRNALAMELFGRGGQEIVPLLNAGSDTIARLTGKAHELCLVMGNDDVLAMAAFSDRWDAIQMQLGMAANRMNAELIPVLDGLAGVLQDRIVPWTDRAAAAVHDAIQWWGGLDENTRRLIVTLAGFAIAIGPAMSLVGRIPGLITAIGFALKTLTSPIGLVISAIVFLASAWITNWGNIRERTQYAIDLIQYGFEQMGIFIGKTWNEAKRVVYSAVLGIMDAAAPIVKILPKSVSEGFENMRAGLREKVSDIEKNLESLAASGVASEKRLEAAHGQLQVALAKTKQGVQDNTDSHADYLAMKRAATEATDKNTAAINLSALAFGKEADAIKKATDEFEAYRKQVEQVVKKGWGMASAIVGALMGKGLGIPTGAGLQQWAGMTPVFDWSSVKRGSPGYESWMSSIPQFGEGGVVKARPGGTLIRAAEAGEDEWFFPESRLRRLADALSGIFRVPAFAPAGFMAATTAGPVYNVSVLVTGNDIHDDYDVERIGSRLVAYLKGHGVKVG